MSRLQRSDFDEAERTATKAIQAAYMVMVTGRRIGIPDTAKSLPKPLQPTERFQGVDLTPPSLDSIRRLCDVLDQGCEPIDRVSHLLSAASMGVASDADVHEPNAHRLAWSIARRLWFDCRDGLMVAAVLAGAKLEGDGYVPGTWQLQPELLREHWQGVLGAIAQFPAFSAARIKAMIQAEAARARATLPPPPPPPPRGSGRRVTSKALNPAVAKYLTANPGPPVADEIAAAIGYPENVKAVRGTVAFKAALKQYGLNRPPRGKRATTKPKSLDSVGYDAAGYVSEGTRHRGHAGAGYAAAKMREHQESVEAVDETLEGLIAQSRRDNEATPSPTSGSRKKYIR